MSNTPKQSLRTRATATPRSARCAAAVLCCAIACAPWASAQSPGAARSDVGAGAMVAPADPSAPPDWRTLTAAFAYVREQVRLRAASDLGERPGTNPLDPPQEPDIVVQAACVTLHVRGAEVGRGVAATSARSLILATQACLEDAERRAPAPRDALQRAARAQMWNDAVISVELGGPLIPIDAPTFAQLDASVQAGAEGVAVRIERAEGAGGADFDLRFPTSMLAANDAPGTAYIALVAALTGDPAAAMPGVPEHEAKAIAKQHHATFYKFRTTHAAQLTPDGPPLPLRRGGRVVERRELTNAQGLREYAGLLSGNLLARRVEIEARPELIAQRWPLQARTGEPAGVLEKSLACVALCRAARVAPREAHDGSVPEEVVAAQSLLVQLLSVDGRVSDAQLSPPAAAGLVLALHEVNAWLGEPREEWYGKALVRLRAVLQQSCDEQGVPRAALREGERGIVALALVTLLKADMQAGALAHADGSTQAATFPSREQAERCVRSIFAATPPGGLVTHMPWLAWAELSLAEDGAVPAAGALRQMRDAVWQLQLPGDGGPERAPELAGGLLLPGSAQPTAQSARPLACCATMLRDERLTDKASLMPELSRTLLGLRFLRQLTLDASWAWWTPDFEHASGGVRLSPSDQRQPIEATAITLLCVTEMIESLQAVQARQAKDVQAPLK